MYVRKKRISVRNVSGQSAHTNKMLKTEKNIVNTGDRRRTWFFVDTECALHTVVFSYWIMNKDFHNNERKKQRENRFYSNSLKKENESMASARRKKPAMQHYFQFITVHSHCTSIHVCFNLLSYSFNAGEKRKTVVYNLILHLLIIIIIQISDSNDEKAFSSQESRVTKNWYTRRLLRGKKDNKKMQTKLHFQLIYRLNNKTNNKTRKLHIDKVHK